jgi:SAM-dependent methyltransferase
VEGPVDGQEATMQRHDHEADLGRHGHEAEQRDGHEADLGRSDHEDGLPMGQGHGPDDEHEATPGPAGAPAPRAERHWHPRPRGGDFDGVLRLLGGLAMSFGRGRSARLVAELAGVGPGDRVVDVGSGPGRFLREAAERGAEAVGVEPSAQMRRVAGWRTPASVRDRVRVLDGTAERLPLEDGTATVVWTVASLHHWDDPEAGLA